ncbi:MAG: murein biosynthesis integral membrane protein MurJ [Fusobacteriaceae bacterium]
MFKSGILMMLVILTSRVLGLVRSVVLAYYFGAGAFTDAYYSAFKISNFFRQLLGEGALGNSFIPLYNDKLVEDGEEKSKEFIFSVLNLVFVFSSLVTILTIVFSDSIIQYTVQGFDESTKELASRLLKIMSSYFLFISLSGMVCAVLNNFKQFLIPASTGIFFNLVLILSSIWAGKTNLVDILGYGVVAAGVLQLLVVLPSFFKKMKKYSFKIDFSDKYLWKIFVMLGPMLIGIVSKQVNTVVDQYFASYLNTGGVSALENATRLYNLPIGMFGITISTIIFPTLAKAISNKRMDVVRDNFEKGLNVLMFLVIPSTFVFTFYSKEIINLTLSYGKFDAEAAKVTAESLFYYSLGLYFYTAIHLVTRAFYGMKNSKAPVKFSVISVVVNIFLNWLLIDKMQYRGLALATSVAAGVNFFALIFVFSRDYIQINYKKLGIFLAKTLMSSLVAIMISYKIENIFLKLLVFTAVYGIFWAYPIYKKRMEVFI